MWGNNNQKIDDVITSRNVNDKYTIQPLNCTPGELYNVILGENVSFVDTDSKEKTFITKSDNYINIDIKDEIIKIDYSNVAGSFTENDLVYILLYEDLLNENNLVVVYDGYIDNLITYFKVVEESMFDTYYMYQIQQVNSNEVFNQFEGYSKEELDIQNMVFSSTLEDDIVELFENSELYKQVVEAQKLAYSNDSRYSYTWTKVKITPVTSKKDGKIIIQLLLSSDFVKTDKQTGKVEKEFTLYMDVINTISFEVERQFNDIEDFYAVVNTKNILSIKVYLSTKDSIGLQKELKMFKDALNEVKKEGSFSDFKNSNNPSENEMYIGGFSYTIYGFSINWEVFIKFKFEMVGEIGIEFTNVTNFKVGVICDGIDNIKIVRDFDTVNNAALYMLGKIEVAAMPRIFISIDFLKVVYVGVNFEAGPYLELGGYIGIQNLFGGDSYSTIGGYIEAGVELNIYAVAGAKLELSSYKIFKKEWRFNIYSNKLKLISIGSSDVPLYFEQKAQTLSNEFDCSGELDLTKVVDTTIVIQDLKTLNKSTKEADCLYYLANEIDGVSLSKDGILSIGKIHRSNIEIVVKVICDSGIYKNVIVNINLNHKPIEVAQKNPTCEEEGMTAYTYCDVCEDIISGDKTVLPVSHGFTVKEQKKSTLRCEATCVEKETYWYKCEYCGTISDSMYFEVGELKAHTRDSIYECKDTVCKDCNTVLLATKKHEYVSGVCKCGVKQESTLLLFEKVDGGYKVVDVKEGTKVEKIIIPSTYQGEPVIELADYCFVDIKGYLKEITIPASIKNIGDLAFANLNGLSSVYYEGTFW